MNIADEQKLAQRFAPTVTLAELNAAIDVRRTPGIPAGYEGPTLPVKEPADA